MLHKLKSSLAEFAESDEVALILKQMLSVCSPPAYMQNYIHAYIFKYICDLCVYI